MLSTVPNQINLLLSALVSETECSEEARVAASQLVVPRIGTLTFAEFSFQIPNIDALSTQLFGQFLQAPLHSPL